MDYKERVQCVIPQYNGDAPSSEDVTDSRISSHKDSPHVFRFGHYTQLFEPELAALLRSSAFDVNQLILVSVHRSNNPKQKSPSGTFTNLPDSWKIRRNGIEVCQQPTKNEPFVLTNYVFGIYDNEVGGYLDVDDEEIHFVLLFAHACKHDDVVVFASGKDDLEARLARAWISLNL
jgi:hypothetical protein